MCHRKRCFICYSAKGSPSFIIVIMLHPSRRCFSKRDDASRKSTFSPRERIGLLLCKYFGNLSAVALLAPLRMDQSHRDFDNVLWALNSFPEHLYGTVDCKNVYYWE